MIGECFMPIYYNIHQSETQHYPCKKKEKKYDYYVWRPISQHTAAQNISSGLKT